MISILKYLNALLSLSLLLFACGRVSNNADIVDPTNDTLAISTDTSAPPANTVPPIETLEIVVPSSREPGNRIISGENVETITQLNNPFSLKFERIYEMAFQDKTTYIIEVLQDETIEVHDIGTGSLIASIVGEDDTQIERIVASQDGYLLATISPGQRKVAIWDLETFEKLYELTLEGFPRWRVSSPIDGAFSFDNKKFVVWGCQTPSSSFCASSRVVTFDLIKRKVISIVNGNQKFTSRVSFNNDATQLVILGEGESLAQIDMLVWDIQIDQEIDRYTCVECEFGFFDGVFVHNQSKFVAAGSDDSYYLFNIDTWQVTEIWELPLCSAPHRIRYIEDSELLVGIDCSSNIIFLSADDGMIHRRIEMGGGYIGEIYVAKNLQEIFIIGDTGYMENIGREIEYLFEGNGYVSHWGIP